MFDWSEFQNWHEYSKLLIGLLAMTDPFAASPVFLSLVSQQTPAKKRRVALIATITFALTMLIFTFFGEAILNLFGITIGAFQIAGGLLLLLMAFDMLRSEADTDTLEGESASSLTSIGIVPLAIPLLAGPGSISTVIIFSNLHETISHNILVGGVVLSVAVIIFLVFWLSVLAGPLLGKTAITVFNRVMGLIVAAIAIEFILDGLVAHFPSLTSIH